MCILILQPAKDQVKKQEMDLSEFQTKELAISPWGHALQGIAWQLVTFKRRKTFVDHFESAFQL